MRRRGWLAAMAVVLLANAVALALVAANRAGEPDALVVFTESELPLASRDEDESGVALRLDVDDLLTAHAWLDRETMLEIGFAPEVIGNKADPQPPLWKLADRQAYVVLEYRAAAPDGARLVAIDAGPDATELRRRHGDPASQIVLPAVVGVSTSWGAQDKTGRPSVVRRSGRLGQLLTGRVHVPRRFHATLAAASPGATPRYHVTLAFGRHHEPWVVNVEPR